MLTMEHLTKKYGSFTALNDISLELEPGVYGLLAPNGAGKTTLLKLITTLLFPTEGRILWDGKEIVSMGEEYRAILGYLPQEFGYYPGYTARRFLRYVADLQCIPKAEAEERMSSLLTMVGMSEHADKKMKQMSGGMKQRIGIAQAMLNDPKILILDEPTAGLDPKERVRFRNLIHSLSKDRIVILSTHIVSDIETIANRIIMIKDHRLLRNDSPQEICRELEGHVYEVPVELFQDESWRIQAGLTDHYIVLSERQLSGGTVIRLYSEKPVSGAAAVSPNLEDAFLRIYQEGEE